MDLSIETIKNATGAYNLLYVGPEAIMFLICSWWLWHHRNKHDNAFRQVMIAWLEFSGAVAIRLGYWLIATASAPEGSFYAWWANEYKYLLLIPAFFATDGISRYIGVIKEWKKGRHYILTFILYVVFGSIGWWLV